MLPAVVPTLTLRVVRVAWLPEFVERPGRGTNRILLSQVRHELLHSEVPKVPVGAGMVVEACGVGSLSGGEGVGCLGCLPTSLPFSRARSTSRSRVLAVFFLCRRACTFPLLAFPALPPGWVKRWHPRWTFVSQPWTRFRYGTWCILRTKFMLCLYSLESLVVGLSSSRVRTDACDGPLADCRAAAAAAACWLAGLLACCGQAKPQCGDGTPLACPVAPHSSLPDRIRVAPREHAGSNLQQPVAAYPFDPAHQRRSTVPARLLSNHPVGLSIDRRTGLMQQQQVEQLC